MLVTPFVLEEEATEAKGNKPTTLGGRWTSFFSKQRRSDDVHTNQVGRVERERKGNGTAAAAADLVSATSSSGQRPKPKQQVVMVLRGWVPQLWRDRPDKFRSLMPKETVQIEGLVKPTDSPGYFAPANTPEQGQWFFYDLQAMAKACGLIHDEESHSNSDFQPAVTMVEEILLKEEAETKRVKLSTAMDVLAFRTDLGRDKQHRASPSSSGGVEELEGDIRVLMSKLNTADLPIRKTLGDFLRFKVTPVDHTNYALTWFTLALCTTAMAFARIRSVRKMNVKAMKKASPSLLLRDKFSMKKSTQTQINKRALFSFS
jgi:cytochrome oxidase assembly protein ShyY1